MYFFRAHNPRWAQASPQCPDLPSMPQLCLSSCHVLTLSDIYAPSVPGLSNDPMLPITTPRDQHGGHRASSGFSYHGILAHPYDCAKSLCAFFTCSTCPIYRPKASVFPAVYSLPAMEDELVSRTLKMEGSLMMEKFLSRNKGPVPIKAQVPNMQDKTQDGREFGLPPSHRPALCHQSEDSQSRGYTFNETTVL